MIKIQKSTFGVKCFIYMIEAVALIVAVLAVVIGVFAFYIKDRPVQVSFLKPFIEDALVKAAPDLNITFNQSRLSWAGIDSPIHILLDDINIKNNNQMDIGRIAELGVSLSAKGLLKGQIKPSHLSVKSPNIYVIRDNDGEISLRLRQSDATPKETLVIDAVASDQSGTHKIKQFIHSLAKKNDDTTFLGNLQNFTLDNAKLTYVDLGLDHVWLVPDLSMDLTKTMNGFDGNIDAILETESAQINIQTSIKHNLENLMVPEMGGETLFEISAEDVPTKDFIQRFEFLEILGKTNVPLNVDIKLAIEDTFDLNYLNFKTRFGEGDLYIKDFFDTALPVKRFMFEGVYDDQRQKFVVENSHLNVFGSKIDFGGSFDLTKDTDNIKINSAFDKVSTKAVQDLWPLKFAPKTRGWLVDNMRDGHTENGLLSITASFSKDQETKKNNFKLNALDGGFSYHNLTIDAYKNMPPVENVIGSAKFDKESFSFDLSSGEVADIPFTSGSLLFSNLGSYKDKLFSLNIEGLSAPVQKVLGVLNEEPFSLIEDNTGRKITDFGGDLVGNFYLKFPLVKDLQFEQVALGSTGTIKKAFVKKAVANHDLVDGDLTYDLDQDGLSVQGRAGLLNTFLDNVTFFQSFKKAPDIQTKISFKGPVNAKTLSAFTSFFDPYIKGGSYVSGDYVAFKNKPQTLTLNMDVTKSDITLLDQISYQKEAGKTGNISTTILFDNKKIKEVKAFKVDIKEPALVASGSISYDKNETIKAIKIDTVKSAYNDFSLNMSRVSNDAIQDYNFYKGELLGSMIDLSYNFDDGQVRKEPVLEEQKNKELSLKDHISLSATLDRFYGAQKLPFYGVKLYLEQDQLGKLDRLEFDGAIGSDPANTNIVNIRYKPNADTGFNELKVRSDNAGAVLTRFGISKRLRGGVLYLDAAATAQHPDVIKGPLLIKNMEAIEAPLIARVISALSITELNNLFSTKEGLKIDRIGTEFQFDQSGKNDVYRLKDGKLKSKSLGLTFEGSIAPALSKMDINGTIIPVSDLNTFIGSIPIVGDILTFGNGGALFAATYSLKGSIDDPKTTVNPLAALAPGFLRQLFFESSFDEKQFSDD